MASQRLFGLFSMKDGKMVNEIKKHTDWITALEFSPDGVLLATGDRNGGLFVWESFTGREYFSLRGHTAAITDVSWRMDSNVLASASEDTTIKLWEMENGGMIKNWGAHGGGVQSVKYSHDGRIASCGRDRVARVWDGNGTAQRTFEAQPDISLRVAFHLAVDLLLHPVGVTNVREHRVALLAGRLDHEVTHALEHRLHRRERTFCGLHDRDAVLGIVGRLLEARDL
jgi:WD40 repeat protein